MGNRIHALAQQLTGKASLEECGLDELQLIAQRYPYFAPAQFLLLQKLRQTGSAVEAEKQYRKAVLFYHDPLLFEHFISSNRFYVEEIMDSDPLSIEQANSLEINERENEQEVIDLSTVIVDTNEADDQVISNQPIINDHLEEERQADDLKTQVNFPSNQEESVSTLQESTEVENIEKEEKLELPNQGETILLKPEGHKSNESTALTFEPYHTVDYFASQGIKISQEELPKDKLGKQLKSFTEWLRTMKRLPITQIPDNMESSAEQRVESMASHSVSESNVVTEAMAEVWLKQGNTEKALDIYNKLSLLIPSKKAYFAAKIENLKQS